MQIQSPSSKRKTEPSAAIVSVYYEERYIGHVLARSDEGFDAYDHNEQKLGAFKTEDEAATAIWEAAHSSTAARNNASDISTCRCYACRSQNCWSTED